MKRSIFSDELFLRDAVSKSLCIADIIRLAANKSGSVKGRTGHYVTVRRWLTEYKINTDHFQNTSSARGLQGRYSVGKAKTLTEHLVIGSTIQTERLKKRLWLAGLLPEKCQICGQLPVWNGLPLVLHLDHINGVNDDNRLENLRILCLHCHSQTPTYAGRNCSHRKIKVPKPKTSVIRKTKIDWPSDTDLSILVERHPVRDIATFLGVSDVAVSKRLRKQGIDKKPVGYWNKPENMVNSEQRTKVLLGSSSAG